MTPTLPWLVGIPLLGLMTGNRTMTPIAVVCWYAWARCLGVDSPWAFWAARPVSHIVFTVLALGELIGDKLPSTPSRLAWFPLIGRFGFGGLCGALAATALAGPWIQGALLGAVTAVAGAFLGYHVRHYLVTSRGFKDLYVALAEDIVTIGLAILGMQLVAG